MTKHRDVTIMDHDGVIRMGSGDVVMMDRDDAATMEHDVESMLGVAPSERGRLVQWVELLDGSLENR